MQHQNKSFFSFRFKVIFALLILINAAVFSTGYLAQLELEESVDTERQEKLLALAKVLDFHLGADGYAEILDRRVAIRTSKEDKIRTLNEELGPYTDKVAASLPGVGIGYYCRELDAIVTYGPSSEYGFSVGKAIAPDHPGREVMAKNKIMVRAGKMVRGEILNVMLPIMRHGEVIGYIWANELLEDIHEQKRAISVRFTAIMLVCSLIIIVLVLLLSNKLVRDILRIAEGVGRMRKDLSVRIKVKEGALGEVAANINAMAEDIGRATAESNRAIKALGNVMNNVPACVYVCDFSTMSIVYANSYLTNLINRGNLVGQTCYETLFCKDKPCANCPQKKLYDANGQPVMTPLYWEEHNDSLGRDFHTMARLLEWHDNRLVCLVFATDTTDRTLLAVANASNMAQRDFLARMSHEIRTPMNGVLGMVRLALQAKNNDEQLGYIRKIESSATILLGIINGILDFSRLEAGKMTLESKAFNLQETIHDVCSLVEPTMQEKGLDLRVDMAANVPQTVVGDKLRLSQIILNLLGNATKFTLKGHVDLKIYAHKQDNGKIMLDCSVIDTGIGMDEEQQEKIFTPFAQGDSSTSRKFGGSGLGLSITKALVQLMDGDIQVRSEPGWGSEFTFYVLLDEATTPVEEHGEEHQEEDARELCKGRTFLVVEDNEINQEIAVAVLNDMGATVDVANNGQEGIKAFMEKDYDIIFMDLRMPIMDGLDATRHIRASKKHDAKTVKIIAMTANVMQEDKDASLEAGMNGHVGKPLDMNELLHYLR